ncbi:MAG: putative lipid II flippase FtsW [Proteobacteria bacterium]|nr:putative lipid II flippase FtsW [Pseudomonadota bacterium]
MHRRSVFLLLVAVGALLALGVVMLASTGEFAQDAHGRPHFFLYHQLAWLGVSVIGCVITSRVDYHFWVKKWLWLYCIALVLLALCFVPHVGARINGSSRWIRLGVGTFQPSEMAKFAAICALSWWYSQEDRVEREFLRGFLVPLAGIGLLMGMIVIEVDVGSTALIGATTIAMMFVAGSQWRYIITLIMIGVGVIAGAIISMPERMGRFMAFLHPELHVADAYQTQQGLIALGSGGITGLGLGNGRQKLLYLPFAHTDFIFPVIGEELGLVGTLGLVLAYIIFILGGVSIAVKARDRAGLLLGMGLVLILALQAAVNLGVTTELLPNKGLPLPFISYGGSNLMFCMCAVGVLLNIYRQGVSEQEEEQMEQLEMALQAEKRVVRL